jgi:hypothetical protein
VLRIELDRALDFDPVRCEICKRLDDDWCVMHFLADGMWRKLRKGLTLRAQGIDETDTTRLYCIHGCTEEVLRTMVTVPKIKQFLNSLNGEGK